MEKIDREKAQRVWQRVQGTAETSAAPELTDLILQELLDAAALTALARTQSGLSPALKRLASQMRSHAACLRGVFALTAGKTPKLTVPAGTAGQPQVVLRACYGNVLRRASAYGQQASDPNFGPVFAHLAAQKQEQCAALAELMGEY